jgi:hypothetical protein
MAIHSFLVTMPNPRNQRVTSIGVTPSERARSILLPRFAKSALARLLEFLHLPVQYEVDQADRTEGY